jgi:hypothetical protein
MKKSLLSMAIALLLCLAANTSKAQAVLGPACGSPCSYKFANNLPCPVKLRVTLVDASGNVCFSGLVGVGALNSACLITAGQFASCNPAPWNVYITVYDIAGAPVTMCNTVDHVSTPSTGYCADPSGCIPSGQYDLTVVPGGGCWAEINP